MTDSPSTTPHDEQDSTVVPDGHVPRVVALPERPSPGPVFPCGPADGGAA
ncbi:hypothetical protein [Janibacter melonis]|nr:hypothetical protein [Janibacter melonis]